MLADITPVILTYNESPNIGRSPVVQRPFDTHARQWRFAVEETGITGGWVLRLDADYMVEPALRDEMAGLRPDQATAAYEIADDRKSLEPWLQSQSRYQAQEAAKLTTRPLSALSLPDRLQYAGVLGPLAVAVHCHFVKRLPFDGSAGFLYTAQRVTADLILSMHLLRCDLGR